MFHVAADTVAGEELDAEAGEPLRDRALGVELDAAKDVVAGAAVAMAPGEVWAVAMDAASVVASDMVWGAAEDAGCVAAVGHD